MANVRRGEVAVESNGQTYTLVIDTNAMAEIEELLSTPEKPIAFADVLQGVTKNNVRHIRAFTWGALRRHHGELTVKDAGAFIDGVGGVIAFAPYLAKIAAAALPDKDDAATAGDTGDDGRPTAVPGGRPPGTGARSTDRRAKSA